MNQGYRLGYKYIWECPCCDRVKNCRYCCNSDIRKVVAKIGTSQGQVYYGNLKYFLSVNGENIVIEANKIIKETGKFTPANLIYIVDLFHLPRNRTKIIAEWLEECLIVPLGTYESLLNRGFQPTFVEL